MLGIDVSHYQGAIDWLEVKRFGVEYVIMKAMNEITHKPDSRFEYNYYQSGVQSIQRGVYSYIVAKNVAQAVQEATDLVNMLDHRTLEKGVWLDLEDKSIKSLGRDKLNRIIATEAGVFRAAGYQVGIYSNRDWYLNVLDGEKLISEYPWWIARYPKNDDGTIKLVLKPEAKFTMWQYSSKGSVDGIVGPVDLDADLDYLGLSNEEVANQIIEGKWGNGQQRINRLDSLGYDSTAVQHIVNKLLQEAKYYPKYEGLDFRIDKVFEHIGVEEEYRGNKVNRRFVAEANGLADYNGTLIQNLKLVSLAKQGQLKRPI